MICLGRDILNIIWASSNFTLDDISIAYMLLIFLIFTMFFDMLGSLYLKLDTARGNIAKQYMSNIIVLIISSVVLVLSVKTYGFSALIFRLLFVSTIQCIISLYFNYYNNKQSFATYKITHLFKTIFHSALVVIVFQALFNFWYFEIELNKIIIFLLACFKTFILSILFLSINKLFKVYDFKSIIKS